DYFCQVFDSSANILF
nr:immunoglobulin light chain junction region [Macaca mulatta]